MSRHHALKALRTNYNGPFSTPEELASTRQKIQERREIEKVVRALNRADVKAYNAELRERETRKEVREKEKTFLSKTAASFFNQEMCERRAIMRNEALYRKANALIENSENPKRTHDIEALFRQAEEQSIRTQEFLERMAAEKEALQAKIQETELTIADAEKSRREGSLLLLKSGTHGLFQRHHCKGHPQLPDVARGVLAKGSLPPLKLGH